jgi:hypothetical protein
MSTTRLPHRLDDFQARDNFDALINGLNAIGQFFYFGAGAPSFTPPGRALYIRTDGGAGTTLYVYEGASWVGK